jgi:hypothetical protein
VLGGALHRLVVLPLGQFHNLGGLHGGRHDQVLQGMELPPVAFVAELDQAAGQFVMVGFHRSLGQCCDLGYHPLDRRKRQTATPTAQESDNNSTGCDGMAF